MRAMFDRIARVYDRMNSVMTAGMHHRWRGRAADLAGVSARRPRARRRHRHRRPGDRAGAPRRRRGRGRDGLRRGDARAGAPQGARRSPSSRATRSRWPTPTTPSTRPPSASARATSPTWRGLAEMARVVRPGRPGGGARDHHARSGRRCRGSSGSGSTGWCPALGRLAGDPDAYNYLPSSVRRFPGPRELAARAGTAAGLTRRALGAHRRRDHRHPRRHGAASA